MFPFYLTSQGFRVVPVEECWHKSMTPLMAEVREMMGDMPVYLTFDIDALDPAYAPGTGKHRLKKTQIEHVGIKDVTFKRLDV